MGGGVREIQKNDFLVMDFTTHVKCDFCPNAIVLKKDPEKLLDFLLKYEWYWLESDKYGNGIACPMCQKRIHKLEMG